ncbi:hypothetical protein MUB04_16280 [Acinetobacter indicus]|uniref:hypothetical protein n=1 Tax=Acinetobacter TaxID=469 RepID=UPI0015D43A15|nr:MULTISPECIES: hypothetical protein [Acinetobacter]MCP0918098.1 hypothetical protein [Acinetobacter indicus]
MRNKPTPKKPNAWSKLSPTLRRNIIAAFVISSSIPVAYTADSTFFSSQSNNNAQSQVYSNTVQQAINTMTTSMSTIIRNNTNEITKAIGTATKQEQVVGEEITDSIVRTAQSYMSAVQAVDMNNKAKDAAFKFGVLGQGYKACTVVAQNKDLAKTPQVVNQSGASIVANTGNQPGSLSSDSTSDRNARIQEHREKFCTITEAQTGVCKLSDLPGGDTNAALLFQSVYPDSKEAEARVAVRRNILGEKDLAIPVAGGRTPQGQEYLLALNHKASMLAFPAYSLAIIDAQNLKQFGDENGDLKSANDILEKTVARYYGGKEALEWQKSMVAQEPRGLLVEAARIEGLEVWMDQQSYEQGLRMEGLLATLVLATAEPFKQKTKEAEKSAMAFQAKISLPDL